jgi:exonuclease III
LAGVTTYLSIVTLNVNGFNSFIKTYHMAKWMKKEALTICFLQKTHITDRKKALVYGKRLEEELPS